MTRLPRIRQRGVSHRSFSEAFHDEVAARLIVVEEAAQRAVWAAPWVPVALAVRAYREWRRLGLADRLCWLALGLAAAYIAARIFVSWWWGE